MFTFEPNPLDKFLLYFDYKNTYKFIYVLYNINYIKHIYYIKHMPIRRGASTLHHALKTVGVQYMFAELN